MYTFECTGDDYCYYSKIDDPFSPYSIPHQSGFCDVPICRTSERCSAVMLKQDVKYLKEYVILLNSYYKSQWL